MDLCRCGWGVNSCCGGSYCASDGKQLNRGPGARQQGRGQIMPPLIGAGDCGAAPMRQQHLGDCEVWAVAWRTLTGRGSGDA